MNIFEACDALSASLDVEDFHEILTPFCLNGRWGYVDEYGLMVIKPEFNYATPFVEGLATVFNDNGWGYIDVEGNVVYDKRYNLERKAN